MFLQTSLVDFVLKAPKEVVCNASNFAYQVFTLVLSATDLIKQKKFAEFKEVFGTDLPLAHCALKNLSDSEKQVIQKGCAKPVHCHVGPAQKNVLMYSNLIYINLVS